MRKEKDIIISDPASRDNGRHYRIREMPAMRTEKWVIRALLALGKAGVELPSAAFDQGAMTLLSIGIPAMLRMDYATMDVLLAEMMECVQIVPDPKGNPGFSRGLVGEDDVEEVLTLLRLRDAVLEVHLGFSIAARLSDFRGTPATEDTNP